MEEIILNLIANKNKEYKVKLDIEDYHFYIQEQKKNVEVYIML